MPLSINKLVKLLVKRGFHPQSFYKIYGVCAFIEIISIRTADNYMLYIPSKYNFKVPPDYPNLYELKEIEVKSNDANTDILNEYGEKPNPLDVEKEYEEILLPNTKLFDEKEKVEQLLKEKYNKPIQITEANSGDNSDVKCIHRQMERLKFCVQNIDYKLVIIYKSYLAFLHTEDVIDMYYITDYDMKAFRNLLVTLDLEVLYNNASTDIELERMDWLQEKIHNEMPNSKSLLLPYIVITEPIKEDEKVSKVIEKYNEWIPDTISEKGWLPVYTDLMVRFQKQFGYDLYWGNDHIEGEFYEEVDCSIEDGIMDVDKLPSKYKDLKIFSGLVQPLRHTNKEEMLEVAKQKGFDDLLYYTWTCWYPNDREPCGECHVCNERIIECKEI